MEIVYDSGFDCPHDGKVFQIFPNVFTDGRGYFTEVMKATDAEASKLPDWFAHMDWIKQVNRSASKGGTIRGCHAQFGKFCQGKFVEALTVKVFDIITDARPDSKTFGLTQVYVLDPEKQNKLWVPRGFLHAFAVPETSETAVFQYFCDNVFNKQSETGVNPTTLLPKVIETMKTTDTNSTEFAELYKLFENDNLTLSEKDCSALDYEQWMSNVKDEYLNNESLWYI